MVHSRGGQEIEMVFFLQNEDSIFLSVHLAASYPDKQVLPKNLSSVGK